MSPPNGSDLLGMPGLGGSTADPAEDPTKNEYYAQRMQTPPWIQAGFPDYASYAQNLRLKEEQARALSQKQLDSNSAASGASVTSAAISTQGANQRAAVQAEIDRAKNAADEAHNAAMDALAQGNAEAARKQFAISSAELERYHTLDIGIRQQEQGLASAKFGNDVYNKLADLASNPRNYMEQFFRMRGQTPPNGSAAYGNTSVTGPGLATAEQFIPKFLQSTGLAGGGYGYGGAPAQAAPAAAPAASPYSGPSGASTAGLSGFDAASGKPRLSPTDPDALGLMAAHPGMYTMTSPEAAKPYIDQLKAEGNNPTVYASSYRQPQQFAEGGSLTMTAPHAIINLLSGKVAAIAGEERGKGPQGFVPETAKFDGKAIIDPKDGITPTNPDPTSPPPPDPYTLNTTYTTGPLNLGTGSLPIPPLVPPETTTIVPATQQTVTQQPITPNPIVQQPIAPAKDPYAITPEQRAAIQAQIAAVNAANAARNQPVPPQPVAASPTQQIPLDANMPPPGYEWNGTTFVPVQATPMANDTIAPLPQEGPSSQPPVVAPIEPPAPSGIVPGPVTTDAPNPGPAPAPVVTPTNIPNPSPSFNDLAQTPSGIGKNPKFLPEDAAADPILAQMLAAGTFPPSLQRIFAQQKGLAGLGTNVPQATELPAGVPLVSKLAYSQMTPNERSAFESYLSAHGLDLPTYLSLVEAASPQGGTSSVNPAIPKFLQQ